MRSASTKQIRRSKGRLWNKWLTAATHITGVQNTGALLANKALSGINTRSTLALNPMLDAGPFKTKAQYLQLHRHDVIGFGGEEASKDWA